LSELTVPFDAPVQGVEGETELMNPELSRRWRYGVVLVALMGCRVLGLPGQPP
jgi:hypothetical protein